LGDSFSGGSLLSGSVGQGWCFDGSAAGPGCNTCARYANGAWVPTAVPPLYRLTSALLERAGINIGNGSLHYYGLCADQHERRHGVRSFLPQHEWRPACEYQQFDRVRACATLRAVGRSILIVGDSTTGQLFLSLVMMLGATLGRNRNVKHVLNDVTASACGDTVRLNFVRRDLLIFSSHLQDNTAARRCNRAIIATSTFLRRAAMADVVILSTGHHFPSFQDGAVPSIPDRAFFTQNVNHTIQSIAQMRAARGLPSGSLVVVGATLPVPHCTRFSQPIELAEYIAADSDQVATRWGSSWRQIKRLNWIARIIARAVGGSYLEVDEMSARRPDAAMAQAAATVQSRSLVTEDCLHYCQPGPTDAHANLVINLLASWQRAVVAAGAAGGKSIINTGFFGVEADEWVSVRGAGWTLEQPTTLKMPLLSTQWWWPFHNCSQRHRTTSAVVREHTAGRSRVAVRVPADPPLDRPLNATLGEGRARPLPAGGP